jgi:hypothetical protein
VVCLWFIFIPNSTRLFPVVLWLSSANRKPSADFVWPPCSRFIVSNVKSAAKVSFSGDFKLIYDRLVWYMYCSVINGLTNGLYNLQQINIRAIEQAKDVCVNICRVNLSTRGVNKSDSVNGKVLFFSFYHFKIVSLFAFFYLFGTIYFALNHNSR